MPNSSESLAHVPEPSTQQPGLPTGLTLVASRSTRAARTPAEVESNSAFLSDAGRVEFGRHEATLREIWMVFAYFASLGPEQAAAARAWSVKSAGTTGWPRAGTGRATGPSATGAGTTPQQGHRPTTHRPTHRPTNRRDASAETPTTTATGGGV